MSAATLNKPDWYETASKHCEQQHNPKQWGGREWEKLSPAEQDQSISEHTYAAGEKIRPGR